MLYSLYHYLTDTHMDNNGLPWYVDTIGWVVDMLTLVGVLYGASLLL